MLDAGHSSALAIDAWQHSSNIAFATHLLSRAHTRAEVSTITRQETLVVWFFVHFELMLVRHRRRAPGEHEGARRKGRRRKGRRCWCLKTRGPKAPGPKVQGPKAQGPKAQGPKVLVFVCVYEGCRRPRAWRRVLAPVSELVVVPATKGRDSGSWTPTAHGGAAGKVQLDSAHRTTGVACRR